MKEEINETKCLLDGRFTFNRFMSMESRFLKEMDEQLEELESKNKREKKLNFEFDSGYIERGISNLGAIIEDESFDYSEFQLPIAVVGNEESQNELVWPQSVTIDQNSGNIFVTDYGNARIRVFRF